MLDLEAGRLCGLMLEPVAPSTTATDDLLLLERAVAFGRRLGWRHSDTAVVVPLGCLTELLGRPRSGAWETLRRYSGDTVATAPPLVLATHDADDVPGEAMVERLARLRVGLALCCERVPPSSLPAAFGHLFVAAETALRDPLAVRARGAGRAARPTVTGVADMASLERLARAGLRCAAGPVFGRPRPVEGPPG